MYVCRFKGAALSNGSSVSQQSPSWNFTSEENRSSSSLSPLSDRYSHRNCPNYHHRSCRDCVSHPQNRLQPYQSNSHRSLSRHDPRQIGYFHDRKSEGKRSKSSHSPRDTPSNSLLLNTLLNDEIALVTITRHQRLLKRELAKQKQLAAELEEAKRKTQQLLEEKKKMEQKVEHAENVHKEMESVPPREPFKVTEEGKWEAPSNSSSSHQRHHRSLSSNKKRHRHRKVRGEKQSSESEENQNSEARHRRGS